MLIPALLRSDTQLNQTSYYEASVLRGPREPVLQGECSADVVVVGAGFAGLSAAIELALRGLSVVLLEADRVCSGASGRNGGQAIVGYASGQQPFAQQLGEAADDQTWAMSLQAIALIDQRIAQFGIHCDRAHGYLYVADSPRKARALQAELAALERRHGFVCDVVGAAQVGRYIDSPRYCAAAYETTSGHLHPLKYGLGLLAAAKSLGVRVFELSPATGIRQGKRVGVSTPTGAVNADFVVLAGNCTLAEYGPGLAPQIAPRIMPVGTYMIATEPLDPTRCERLIARNAAVCDNNFALDYFRFSADSRLLLGGRVSYTTMTPTHLEERMRCRMVEIFPTLRTVAVDHVWGGFVDITMNRAPDFGRIAPNIFYLQGFSGHGVALTGLAGQLAAQAIAGQADRFDVFAALRHRAFPGGKWLRTPALALGMLYYQLKDLL